MPESRPVLRTPAPAAYAPPSAHAVGGAGAGASRSLVGWLDPLKAFALLAILLNHLVEEFGPGPWFTNPSSDWPPLAQRLQHLLPTGDATLEVLLRLLGWLGDSGPGVFIVASGVGLALGALSRDALQRNGDGVPPAEGLSAFLRRRLARIWPLYAAMHLVIAAAALLVPGSPLTLRGPERLLSILGLRVTPALFFSISPSWWFVWLVLQLYMAFPALMTLLRRVGPGRFLMVTLTVGIGARAAGVLLLAHSPLLYFWMTGLSFLTRLPEFAAGMALAAWLRPRALAGSAPEPTRREGWLLAACYPIGLAASLFLPTTVVANLFVSLGLVGIFLAVWTLVRRHPAAARGVQWLGAHSYAIFLLHQPPLRWTSALGASPRVHFALAVVALAATIPAAVLVERAVDAIPGWLRTLRPVRARLLSRVGSLAVFVALALADPIIEDGGRLARLLALALAGAVGGLALLEWRPSIGESRLERSGRRAALLAASGSLFVLPLGDGWTALLVGCVMALGWWMVEPVRGAAVRFGTALAAVALMLAGLEGFAGRRWPREAGAWGERDALEEHPTRAYGLRPDRVTALRYNDYDYTVRTNGLGLAGPEPAPRSSSGVPGQPLRILAIGDAFTMPEGVSFDDGYPAQLQRRLDACMGPARAEVIDAGVTGYGPAEERVQLRELVPYLHPDVIAYEFFVNEFTEVNLTATQRRADIGLSTGWLDVARAPQEHSQLVANLRLARDAAREQLTARPAAARVWKSLLGYYRVGDNRIYGDSTRARLAAALADMQRTAREARSSLVVFFVPAAVAVSAPGQLSYLPPNTNIHDTTQYDVDRPLRELQALAIPLGVHVVDLSPALRETRHSSAYFARSWHWTPEGHRLAAGAIAASLATQGVVPPTCGALK